MECLEPAVKSDEARHDPVHHEAVVGLAPPAGSIVLELEIQIAQGLGCEPHQPRLGPPRLTGCPRQPRTGRLHGCLLVFIFHNRLSEVIDPPVQMLAQQSLEHELNLHIGAGLRLAEPWLVMGLLEVGAKVDVVEVILETLLVVLENSILHQRKFVFV